MYKYRCDGRLKAESEGSTRLTYTGPSLSYFLNDLFNRNMMCVHFVNFIDFNVSHF
jgi:hypothetical protein